MQEFNYIIASNGVEVIDPRPQAMLADDLAKHFEESYAREKKREYTERLKRSKHPFICKLMTACGLLQKEKGEQKLCLKAKDILYQMATWVGLKMKVDISFLKQNQRITIICLQRWEYDRRTGKRD